jgi:ankyrin repeat protein
MRVRGKIGFPADTLIRISKSTAPGETQALTALSFGISSFFERASQASRSIKAGRSNGLQPPTKRKAAAEREGPNKKMNDRAGAAAEVLQNKKQTIHSLVRWNQGGVEAIQAAMFANSCCDVNEQDQHGNTPLHIATQNGHLDIVQFLVEQAGIQVNAQNKKGLTSLHMAIQYGYKELAACLQTHGAKAACLQTHGAKAACLQTHGAEAIPKSHEINGGSGAEKAAPAPAPVQKAPLSLSKKGALFKRVLKSAKSGELERQLEQQAAEQAKQEVEEQARQQEEEQAKQQAEEQAKKESEPAEDVQIKAIDTPVDTVDTPVDTVDTISAVQHQDRPQQSSKASEDRRSPYDDGNLAPMARIAEIENTSAQMLQSSYRTMRARRQVQALREEGSALMLQGAWRGSPVMQARRILQKASDIEKSPVLQRRAIIPLLAQDGNKRSIPQRSSLSLSGLVAKTKTHITEFVRSEIANSPHVRKLKNDIEKMAANVARERMQGVKLGDAEEHTLQKEERTQKRQTSRSKYRQALADVIGEPSHFRAQNWKQEFEPLLTEGEAVRGRRASISSGLHSFEGYTSTKAKDVEVGACELYTPTAIYPYRYHLT